MVLSVVTQQCAIIDDARQLLRPLWTDGIALRELLPLVPPPLHTPLRCGRLSWLVVVIFL